MLMMALTTFTNVIDKVNSVRKHPNSSIMEFAKSGNVFQAIPALNVTAMVIAVTMLAA